LGLGEGMIDENTGRSASISKIIQNISKTKKQRKEQQESVADVDYTTDV